MKIIVDPGSCHYGKIKNALKLIASAAKCGADAIKFQLFKDIPPNIPFNYNWFPDLVAYGIEKKIEVFASVWDDEGLNLLRECKCKSVKFATSQNKSPLIEKALIMEFDKVFISYDNLYFDTDGVFDVYRQLGKIVRLFCVPEYPVFYNINFDGLFKDNRFDGFSDHSLGTKSSIYALGGGAKYIEKHFQIKGLETDCKCRDAYFAIYPDELAQINRFRNAFRKAQSQKG